MILKKVLNLWKEYDKVILHSEAIESGKNGLLIYFFRTLFRVL